MIYDTRRDMHDSLDNVLLYAAPNYGAIYTADSIAATKWDGDYPRCSVCGRTTGDFAVHHEPPRSKGSLLLCTEYGEFVVKPTLILLCGSCHAKRHNGSLAFSWRFKGDVQQKRFLTGWYFKEGLREHDSRFKRHGDLWVIENGIERVIR